MKTIVQGGLLLSTMNSDGHTKDTWTQKCPRLGYP